MKITMRWVLAIAVTTAAAIGFHLTQSKPAAQRTVAIATLVSHPALDAMQARIVAELAAQGFREGEQIRLVLRNASGQMQVLPTMAREIASMRPDLTIAITTPVAQAVVKAVPGPIVFGAVSDPVGAGIVQSLTGDTGRVTGATDAWPYNDQLRLVREVTPAVRRLGVIYNPAESSSQYGMRLIREYAPRHGLEIIEGAVGNSSEVLTVAEILARKSDALMLSSDSTAIGGVAAALRVATQRQLPLYVGDSGTVSKGGLAAVSIGYERLGTQTGELAARVLRGEKSVPIVNPDSSEIVVNTRAAELMGVTIPPSVLSKATRIDRISQ